MKILKRILDMMFAIYREPYAYYDEEGRECYSHHTKFVRLAYEEQADGILLVASANRLFMNHNWFANELHQIGFREINPHLGRIYYYIKINMESRLFMNNLNLLLSDEAVNRNLGRRLMCPFFDNVDAGYADKRFEYIGFFHRDIFPYYFDVINDYNSQVSRAKNKRKISQKELLLFETHDMYSQESKPYRFEAKQKYEYYRSQNMFLINSLKHLFI